MERTIFNSMDSLLQKIKKPNGGLDPRFFDESNCENIKEEIAYIKETLNINHPEALLMSAIVQNAGYGNTEITKISNWFGFTYLKFQSFMPILESLSNKWLIKIKNNSEISIPRRARKALKENHGNYLPDYQNLTSPKVLSMIKNLFIDRRNGWLSERDLMEELTNLVTYNPDLSISIGYRKYGADLDWFERLMFFALINRYANYNDDEFSLSEDFYNVFEDKYEYEDFEYDYQEGRLELMTKGIIEYTSSEGIITKDYCCIINSIKNEILADVGGVKKTRIKIANYIPVESIVEKPMFYNPDEKRQIEILSGLIDAQRFSAIQESLKQSGMRTGFSCLFYGGPGTGKTETVYQLAKQSGRGLIVANVSELKNCYVGESEKNVQALFDNYRKVVQESELAPILLFNEADAIFGIRKSGAESAVDKMENSLQNIILQEMEKLNGILIATTNLTENLDKAFERRFLYKIRFGKPSLEARCNIWKSMIPSLSDDEALILADSYNLSGGQIENVARKRTIDSIINGVEPTIEDTMSYCNAERIESL